MKPLAAFWDWRSGAPVPDARVVIAKPGLVHAAPNEDRSWRIFDALAGGDTWFVVDGANTTQLDARLGRRVIPALLVQKHGDLARLPDLLAVKAERRVLVVSPEEAIDLGVDLNSTAPMGWLACSGCNGWGGGETGSVDVNGNPYERQCGLCKGERTLIDAVFIVGLDKPIHPDWVRGVVEQCRAAGAPCVFLGWGSWLPRSQSTAAQRRALALERNHRQDADVVEIGGGDVAYQFSSFGYDRSGALLDGVAVADEPTWIGCDHG